MSKIYRTRDNPQHVSKAEQQAAMAALKAQGFKPLGQITLRLVEPWGG